MNPSLLLLLAALSVFPGLALAVQDCDLNGEHINPDNGSTTQGKTGIMRCRDRDSGRMQREQELRNGAYVGLVRYYDYDGRLEREFSVNEQGNEEGRRREFSPANGAVIRDGNYRNGTPVGISRSFYPSGQAKRVTFYDDKGKEQAAVEYTPNGQLRDLRCADKPVLGKDADDAGLCGHRGGKPAVVPLFGDKGEARGRVTHQAGQLIAAESYWENGKPKEQQETSADSQVEREFSRDGIKLKETRWRRGDTGLIKELEQEFSDRGQMTQERRWQDGELAEEKTFYLNGQPHTADRYMLRDDLPVMESEEFHDNGKIAFKGEFLGRDRYRQKPVGTQQRFDAEGRLRKESGYDSQGRLAREKEYDETGRVTRDDAVFEDGSRKAYAVPGK
ncbi:MAG TPA: hypothetical protein VI457_06975 [Methylococcaceae bacterium]|nr:hypothetical protein [Methylococcaceae bacterium]